MALFVLGAGATRGSSFVDASTAPCLPPLDADFFTQLQRVRNPKHDTLVSAVMADVVDLFGSNFDVSMETVFATLGHTLRMLETTGENRAFRKTELRERRERLEQAIAVVLEDSLTETTISGGSSQKPRACEYHKRLVEDLMEPKDDIVGFNYDCVLDYALREHGSGKWNPRFGYGFGLGKSRNLVVGSDAWMPLTPATREDTISYFKLHGSLHFRIKEVSAGPEVTLKQRPYTHQNGNLRFTIIPPEWDKAYDRGAFSTLWAKAAEALHRARHVVVIGYSLPLSDLHSTALFRTSIKKGNLKSLVVVNPDREARKRIRSVFQRGFDRTTKVVSFDYLSDFVASDRRRWTP